MGSVLASAVLARAADIYNDTGYTWKDDAKTCDYLEDGEREICKFKPDAYVVVDSYKLVAGIKQSLPDGTASFLNPSSATLKAANMLIRPRRNMGTTGIVPGRAIQKITWDEMTALNPLWPAYTESATVQFFYV